MLLNVTVETLMQLMHVLSIIRITAVNLGFLLVITSPVRANKLL